MTSKQADEDYATPTPPLKRKRTTLLVFTESESEFPALNLSRPPTKNAWKERSISLTKRKRRIEGAEVTSSCSQDKVMTQGSNHFLDEIVKLRTDTKQQAADMKKETDERIEAAQKEMTTLLEDQSQMHRVTIEQMSKLTKKIQEMQTQAATQMQEIRMQAATQTQAIVNNLSTCFNFQPDDGQDGSV
jgi:dGTP triphosphohydrolase